MARDSASQFQSAGHRHGQAPRLERAGGIDGFVLDVEPVHAQPAAQAPGVHQGRSALAQGDDGRFVAHRKHLAVAPQGRFAHRQDVRGQCLGCCPGVVPGEQRPAAVGAQVLQPIRRQSLAAVAAFQVDERSSWFSVRGCFVPQRPEAPVGSCFYLTGRRTARLLRNHRPGGETVRVRFGPRGIRKRGEGLGKPRCGTAGPRGPCG